MDLSSLGNCVPIIMICYGVGFACKTFPKIPDERIPVIMLLVGGVLGTIGMRVIPSFPATDYITAVAVGMFNGLTATGINQLYKQSKKA
jgi:hypothetical protein|nr:MAG TPA_asm: holin [Caudoviricetes sp.]